MNHDARMKGFLEALARALVTHPEQAQVKIVDGRRATTFEIHVASTDRGQLIGKEGMTIRAIRTLADVSAHRHRRRFEVEIPG
ncbi:MAG: KH domain-containing protein [Acidobacteria bacterium]|nr:KH domain-containing protein [Acidobacteriota bacterium]